MNNTLGYGLAVFFATSSIAFAGGGGGEGEKNADRLSSLATEPVSLRDVTVKAAAGEGITISSGDDFSLNFSNGVQFNWMYSSFDAPGVANTNSFGVKRARTWLSGNVWNKDITYYVELRWESAPALLEGWANWNFWHGDNEDTIGVRAGIQRLHGREFSTLLWRDLEHTNRSLASSTFTGNRVNGAMLHGQHLEGGKLHWGAGIGNNDVALASAANEATGGGPNPDNELSFFFNAAFDPWGNMDDYQGDLDGDEWRGSIGASLMVGNNRVAPTAPDVESTDININIAAKGNGFYGLGEVFIRSDDVDGGMSADSTGWAIGGSYTLPPAEGGDSQWSFAVRYSMIDLDDAPILLVGTPLGGTAGDIGEIEGTVSNYYHRHKLKTQVNYKHQTVSPTGGSDVDNDFIEIQFQWIF